MGLVDGKAGIVTGASMRNWVAYGDHVHLAAAIDEAHRALLCDPQTSGGLLVACDTAVLADVMDVFRRHGFTRAAAIGNMGAGEADVTVYL